MRVTDRRWPVKHWKAIRANYARAPHFDAHEAELEAAYEAADQETLSQVNSHFIATLCEMLDITTDILSVLDMEAGGDRIERLGDI